MDILGRTLFRRCVQCPSNPPTCPTCMSDEVCFFLPATCTQCASTYCGMVASSTSNGSSMASESGMISETGTMVPESTMISATTTMLSEAITAAVTTVPTHMMSDEQTQMSDIMTTSTGLILDTMPLSKTTAQSWSITWGIATGTSAYTLLAAPLTPSATASTTASNNVVASTPSQIGIGVGITLGALAAVLIGTALAMAIVKHRRRMLTTYNNNKLETAELAGPSWNYQMPGAQIPAELAERLSRAELETRISRAELAARRSGSSLSARKTDSKEWAEKGWI